MVRHPCQRSLTIGKGDDTRCHGEHHDRSHRNGSRPRPAGQARPPAVAAGAHGAGGRPGDAARDVQERRRAGHRPVQRRGDDKEPPHHLHAQQGVPRKRAARHPVPERRRAGGRRELCHDGRLQESQGHRFRRQRRRQRRQQRRGHGGKPAGVMPAHGI